MSHDPSSFGGAEKASGRAAERETERGVVGTASDRAKKHVKTR